MSYFPDASLVRILAHNSTSFGCGVLVDSDLVVTCSHVVRELDKKTIYVDFPKIAADTLLLVEVVVEDAKIDLAVLRIEERQAIPEPAVPKKLQYYCKLSVFNYRAWGFTGTHPNGMQSEGGIEGKDLNGWYQCTPKSGQTYPILPGFSGGPIWVEDLKGIVGLAIASDQEKLGYILPADVISKCLLEEAPSYHDRIITLELPVVHQEAICALQEKHYARAEALVSAVLDKNPADCYALAIQTIAGFRSRTVRIEKLESQFRHIVSIACRKDVFFLILGLIRYEHYVLNNLSMPPPTFAELRSRINTKELSQIDDTLVKSISANPKALEYFGMGGDHTLS